MGLPQVPQVDLQTLSGQALISPSGQAIIAAIFIFFLLILIGLSRRFLARSSLQGMWAGFVMGLLFVGAILGGFVYLTREFTTGEKAQFISPELRAALGNGKEQAAQVLGVEGERKVPTAQSVVSDYDDLGKLDVKLVREYICKPETSVESNGSIQ